MMTETKTELSKKLEQHFFRSVLKRREIDALKARCENYQLETAPEWSPGLFLSYSQYFGFLSALKVRSVFFELAHRGYLNSWKDRSIQLVDFGCGTLGASLGAVDFLRAGGWTVDSVVAIDKDRRPAEWGQAEFKDFLPRTQVSAQMPSSLSSGQILVAVDVLNELESWDAVSRLVKKLPKDSLLILIEPASKSHNQKLLKWRNETIKELPPGVSLLLPCTHSMPCPALEDREWCHEEWDYKAPSVYWNLVHEMKFKRSRLTFSLMVFGSQPTAFKASDARVVSQILRPKGRCEKWLCANGKRWKCSLLERHRSEENEFIYDARRGDVLDCDSTGLKPND